MRCEVISRCDAAARGLKRYFTGKPCRHGHISERYVCSRICDACLRAKQSAPDGRAYGRFRWAKRSHREKLVLWAKYRHILKGCEGVSDITIDDLEWPEFCPALGIRLHYAARKNERGAPDTPTIDRIDATKGYVRGNVQILSRLANQIKTNATPEQIMQVALFVAKGQRQ